MSTQSISPSITTPRAIQTTLNVQPLIQQYTEEMVTVSIRDLALFFHQAEVAVNSFEQKEIANFHPVAGRYFRVAEQHERNNSWLYRGKKEALISLTTKLKDTFSLDQQVHIEQAGGALRKELFDIENERETDARIREVLTKEAKD